MNKITLQKKRARKEAKRNLKRVAIRKARNRLNSLGISGRNQALSNARRTASINFALANLDAVIKKYNDVISLDLLTKVQNQKAVLRTAMRTKNADEIQKAVNDFVPLNQEVIDIVQKYDAPKDTVIPVKSDSDSVKA